MTRKKKDKGRGVVKFQKQDNRITKKKNLTTPEGLRGRGGVFGLHCTMEKGGKKKIRQTTPKGEKKKTPKKKKQKKTAHRHEKGRGPQPTL